MPRLAAGAALLGPLQGSGFRDTRYLMRRADGQTVLVSPLLYLLAFHCNGRQDVPTIADAVSETYGRRLTPANALYLIEAKLEPLGIVVVDEEPEDVPKSDLLLGLAGRRVILRPNAVRAIARVLAPMFFPPLVLVWLAAFLAVDVWVFGLQGDLLHQTMEVAKQPELLLLTIALVGVSMFFHELGHAAACRYGGASPGAIGAGLYLIFPAFYTNVTDAYRLGRIARLRTDLGGIYFNAVFVVVIGVIAATQDVPVLVLVMVIIHMEMLQQLLPIVRFDGYFLLCDLAGVPDLFSRVEPSLRGVVRAAAGRGADDLRPKARRMVRLWVLVVVPLLTLAVVFAVKHAPELVREVTTAVRDGWSNARAAFSAGRIAAGILAAVNVVIVALPLLGLCLVAARVVRRLLRKVGAWAQGLGQSPTVPALAVAGAGVALSVPAPPKVAGNGVAGAGNGIAGAGKGPTLPSEPAPAAPPGWAPPSGPPTAIAFTEEAMLRPRRPSPEAGWRRAVYRCTGGLVNVGPSRAEAAHRELLAKVRAPVMGNRRVVVLCRKGGAGKTTTTLMLGHTFATHRGDRVVALDANPDAGSLAHRVRRETSQTVTSMLGDRTALDRYADIRSYTSQAVTRLEVIASDDDPRITQRLGDQDYHQAIGLLDTHYNLILVDTGTGILDAGIQGVLLEADQIVVVMPPALDGARVAAATLDWLEEHGHGQLVESAVAVINGVRRQGVVELERVEDHFQRRCSSVLRVPWDPALAAGAATELDELRPATRAAYLKLAAVVADQFRTPSPREAR
jgi:putative peptide zinc metalloprotease protein